MNQHNSTPSIETRLRTLQMLVGALVIGVVTFAGFLPFLLGPIGGVLADRFERKRLAAISTAISATAVFQFKICLSIPNRHVIFHAQIT